MKKEGISLVSISIAIVIMFVLVSIISVTLTYSITNAKKLSFAKEIYNIQNLVTEYIEREETLPTTAEALQISASDRTQFAGETFNNETLNLEVVDMQVLGIKNTNYGNREIGSSEEEVAKDIYAVSSTTGKVYYIAGFEAGGKKYYTLTDELKQMIEKKQNFIINEKEITFTPSKIGWSAEGVSVTAFVPTEFASPSISIDNENITYTSASSSEGTYYNVNTAKLAQGYTITISYTKNGNNSSATYVVRMDTDYPTITKDLNITNTSDYIKGLNSQDETSSIKYFKYAEGVIGAENISKYMHAYGKDISGGNMKFDIRKDAYTIYAEDKAGNYTAMYIDVYGNLVANNPARFYVPAGFVVSSLEGETEIEEGRVIYEGTDAVTSADLDENGIIDDQENRNQYVWVPVPDINEFVRRDGYEGNNSDLQTFVSAGTTREPVNYTDDWTREVAEYNKMYNSVRRYGGFYIARYEAGSETKRTNTANGTTTLVPSKKDKYPYNYVAWGKNEWNINGDVTHNGNNQGKGAVVLSRSVYPESSDYGVVSTLIYGVQWDAVVKIYSDSGINIKSNRGMGYYAYQNTDDQNPNYKTGIDLTVGGKTARNKLKNIYDMAGNMLEWTMENGNSSCRVTRGGGYYVAGWQFPVSYRNVTSPGGYTYAGTSFRIALYIK